jgi:hypothetical protein
MTSMVQSNPWNPSTLCCCLRPLACLYKIETRPIKQKLYSNVQLGNSKLPFPVFIARHLGWFHQFGVVPSTEPQRQTKAVQSWNFYTQYKRQVKISFFVFGYVPRPLRHGVGSSPIFTVNNMNLHHICLFGLQQILSNVNGYSMLVKVDLKHTWAI